MSDHERFEDLISLYLDGALDEAGEAELRVHLESCRACRELLGLLTGVHDTLSVEKDPPEALLRGVLEGVECVKRTRKTVMIRRTGLAVSLAAAAAALALVPLRLQRRYGYARQPLPRREDRPPRPARRPGRRGRPGRRPGRGVFPGASRGDRRSRPRLPLCQR